MNMRGSLSLYVRLDGVEVGLANSPREKADVALTCGVGLPPPLHPALEDKYSIPISPYQVVSRALYLANSPILEILATPFCSGHLERSMNDFLTEYCTIKEYFDSFNSLFNKMGFDEWYLVDLFICGLPWELGNNVSSMMLNESIEEEKDSSGLVVSDNFENVDDEIKKKNKRKGLSNEIPDGVY
ncbi:hypothetical protein Tco_1149122 [Tanacetum coccineum]